MEAKTNALVLTVIVAILLIIAIRYKIKSDKKNKSILIASPKRNNNKLFWESSPALALYALLGGFVVLFSIPEDWVNVEAETSMALVFLIWGVVNAICCFFIVRQNPKSIWYVPLIINLIYLISGFVENHNASDWISVCSIFVLSILASIIGSLIGKRTAISAKS